MKNLTKISSKSKRKIRHILTVVVIIFLIGFFFKRSDKDFGKNELTKDTEVALTTQL